MIILDTNVLSELMRPAPDARVVTWFGKQTDMGLWTTALTRAEMLHGVASLPPGRRRTHLANAIDAMFRDDFQSRVLAFTSDAAVAWAEIVVSRKAAGRPISHVDAQIAAIARTVDATVATRNVEDFSECGLTIVNPWDG